MSIFGLWISKNENIEELLSSGIWVNRLSNTERIPKQLARIKVDDKVFVYQGLDKVKVLETPFAPFTDSNKLNKSIVKVRSIAIGKVVSINNDERSISIKWHDGYKQNEWYGYFRSDGIWNITLDGTNTPQQQKYKELYQMAFENKEQNYEWWVNNGLLDDRNNQSKKRDISMKSDKTITKQALNQILYGPPGTGKTYNTINRAIEIIDNDFYQQHCEETPENRKLLKEKFEAYKEAGQIEFVTFHQSYGYEEFVEGIKANSNDGIITYDIENGIFKKLCKTALQKNRILADLKNIDFNDYLKIGEEFSSKLGKTFRIKEIDEDIVFENPNGANFDAKRKTIIDHLQNEEVMESDEYYSSQVYIARMIYEKLAKSPSKTKNHILIIDEINRGNISKIFGELITLIEPSKRIGADEEITLSLPNSPEPFGVPSNLYIIGTMNTADRSIAQIDTALRRRFVFEEMMPRAELLVDENNNRLIIEDTDIDVQKILEAINERIEYIYDREHTIGHSYFLPLIKNPTKEKLDEIFRVNIIPLLAEYFYGDWGDIAEILNNDKGDFIIDKTQALRYKPKTDRQNRVYSISKEFSTEGYMNIYDLPKESNS